MRISAAAGRIASATVAVGMVGTLVVALAAATAPNDTGRMTAHQATAGIWVIDEASGMLGRADLGRGTVEPVMPIGSQRADLVQSSNTAIVIDRAGGVASTVDAASLERSRAVRLPSDDAQLALAMMAGASDRDPVMDAAILSPRDGNLWAVSVVEFGNFDAASAPAFSFGPGAGLAVGEGGALFVASPRDGALYEIGQDGAERRAAFEPFRGSGSTPVHVSVGPAGWSVLDARSKRLITADGVVDLANEAGEPALEVALSSTIFSPARAGASLSADAAVFFATEEGLLQASAGEVRTRVRAEGATPLRPIRVGDCVYGAWDSDARAVGCETETEVVRTASSPAAPAWVPASNSRPELRTDGHRVIANDPATGETWALTPDGPRPLTWESEPGVEALHLSDPTSKMAVPEDAEPIAPHEADPPTEVVATDPPVGADAEEPPPAERDETDAPSGLTAGRVETVVDRGAGTIEVSWDPFASEGSPVLGYLVQRLAPGETAGECVVEGGAASVAGGEVHATTGRSTFFGGNAPPEGGYRFLVWGYTADDCAASAPVEVQPEPVPAAVTDPHGEMAWIGSRYDYRIAPGDARRYEVQRLDAAGSPAGAVGVFAGSTVPRELTAGAFGEPVRFAIRACTVWGADAACSPWTEHTAPEPSLDFTLADLAYSEERSEWTWSALPDNGGASPRWGCGAASRHVEAELLALSCRYLEPVSTDEVILPVRIKGVLVTYEAKNF